MKYVNFFDYKLSNLNINDLVNRIFNEKDENVSII